MKIKILFPMYCTGKGVSYTCLSLASSMQKAGGDIHLLMCAADKKLKRDILHTAIPHYLNAFFYRAFPSQNFIRKLTEFKFIREAHSGDIVYLWPGVSFETYLSLRKKGCIIVVERINCHRLTAKKALDDAYKRCGIPFSHGITDADIAMETEKLMLSDYIFSPSPMVHKSLLEAGINKEKIIDSSYGWDTNLYTPFEHIPSEGLTVLFVGRLCIRKGVHLLLDIWKEADIKGGRLIFAGFLEPELEKLCSQDFKQRNVVLLGFVNDVAQIYSQSDIFVFPSLEEGGPQVTYEAMAYGLPVIVSQMGAGAVVRNGQDGYVINPYDKQAWIQSLKKLANDSKLRAEMGKTGQIRAQEFVWEKVGKKRLYDLKVQIDRQKI
ncbi:MAG: glycosyltransferase family 4 protein [Desulfobacterales bacterium]|nr:glycosyltransferase family 4 protein [Desulfobacterales bacterium]MBF0395568.1 glycosyltransferase family 4 protein [Desulfobacterales bacterium]